MRGVGGAGPRADARPGYASVVLTWTLIAVDWTLRIVMAVVVLLRKKASDAMPWLLVCLAFPIVGLLLYVLIGGNRLGSRRSKEHARAMHAVDGLTRMAKSRTQNRDEVPERRRDLACLAERMGHFPFVGGNAAEVIGEPTDYLNRLVGDIDGAKSCVHCLYYIFEDDRAGREVAAALRRAASRGVKVRLLVDAVGSRGLFRRLGPELERAGVMVRAALPVNPLRRRLARIDLRNHRKLAVIDGATVYTGSQNIVDPAAGTDGGGPKRGVLTGSASKALGGIAEIPGVARLLTRSRRQWDDLSVRMRGPIALQGDAVFLEDWYSATGEVLHVSLAPEWAGGAARREGDAVAQLVPSGPTYEGDVFHDFMVAALHDADTSIELCTPYFVPSEPVLLALKIAASRGVGVDVVVPERSDHLLVSLAARSHFRELLDAGVRVHLHRGLMLHTKSMAVDDDLAIIGSGNLDMRSFHLNFELNTVLYGGAVTESLHREHRRYMEQSKLLRAGAWAKRPLGSRLLEKAVGLMGPLL